MKDIAEQFKHKGLTVKLIYDTDCESPLEADAMPRVARFQSGYKNPAPEFRRWEDVQYAVKHEGAKAFGLWGGDWGSQDSTFEVRKDDPFKDEDLGREHFGFVVYPKDLIPQIGSGSGRRDVLYKDAVGVIEEYEKWCNGECYGYVIENASGEELDSCWGFIGEEYAKESAIEAADRCAKEEAERTKTYTAIKEIDEDGEPDEYEVEAVNMEDALRQLNFDPISLRVGA